MAKTITRRAFALAAAGVAALAGTACAASAQEGISDPDTHTHTPTVSASKRVEDLIGTMTLEQKTAQMIMPAIRAWEGEDNGVTTSPPCRTSPPPRRGTSTAARSSSAQTSRIPSRRFASSPTSRQATPGH